MRYEVSPIDVSVLEDRLRTDMPRVAVMGLGYVGLPVALALVQSGCQVVGFDVNATKVEILQRGETYIRDVPPDAVQAALKSGRFVLTDDARAIAAAEVVLICVPTPFTPQKEPDVSYIETASRTLAAQLTPGRVVILRSTSYPGTTNGVVRPILETTGLMAGRDFFLAFAPERIDPGNRSIAMHDVPVVVGGIEPTSTRLAAALLGRIARHTVPVSSPEAAEMTKLLENVFRNVNIALVNQVAQLCDRMALDVWEIVDAAATKPYGFMSFRPGLVGGHCIPVDPYYMAWKAREYDFSTRFIELAGEINTNMPYHVVTKVMEALNDRGKSLKGSKIMVLGVAYKKNVDDMRESPAIPIIRELLAQGVILKGFDPAAHEEAMKLFRNNRFSLSQTLEDALLDADAIVLVTRWEQFRAIPQILKRVNPEALFVDGRRMLNKNEFIRYEGIGL